MQIDADKVLRLLHSLPPGLLVSRVHDAFGGWPPRYPRDILCGERVCPVSLDGHFGFFCVGLPHDRVLIALASVKLWDTAKLPGARALCSRRYLSPAAGGVSDTVWASRRRRSGPVGSSICQGTRRTRRANCSCTVRICASSAAARWLRTGSRVSRRQAGVDHPGKRLDPGPAQIRLQLGGF